MVKKLEKLSADRKTAHTFAESVKDSAQQIWLAGLGAFAKAEEERGKVFDTLVKEGVQIQRRTQVAAEEKIAEATNKMVGLATGLSSKATGFSSLATGQWDKLENIFEGRVAKALGKLGMPPSSELADLVERIDALERCVQKLMAEKASPVKTLKASTGPKATSKATSKSASKPKPNTTAKAKPSVKSAKAAAAVPAKKATKAKG